MSDFAQYGFDDVIPKPWTSKVVGEVFQKGPELLRKTVRPISTLAK